LSYSVNTQVHNR